MARRDFVTIVSGLPRSGTSLAMQMLAAGGMPLLTDGVRQADEDNPRGYFEFEPVKRTRADHTWVAGARGKAVKMVYLLLRDLPRSDTYRVILMERDLPEVIASQRAMLQRLGRSGAEVSDERMATIFAGETAQLKTWLREQPNFAVLNLNYDECLNAPDAAAHRISGFLDGELDEARMAAAIDRTLYRRSSIKAVLS